MLTKIGNFLLLAVLWVAIIQDALPPVEQSINWTLIVIACIGAVPGSVASAITFMTLLQSRQNAKVAAATDVSVKQNLSKTDTVIEKATEIHTLTNSNLSKVQAQLEVSNRTIEGLHQAQAESARRMASMELMITSLIPTKDHPSPSQVNGEKLDTIKHMLSDVQHGTPPIPVKDEAVLKKLEEVTVITDKKLDTIQETAEAAAHQAEKEKKET